MTTRKKMRWFEALDILLDGITGVVAWFAGVWLVFTDSAQLGILCLILAFVVEHVVSTKIKRNGWSKGE